MLADAVVDALEVAAQDDEVLRQRQGVGHGLVELLAVGRGENHFVVVAFGLQAVDAAFDGLDLHHHAGKASEGVIVHAAVLVLGVVAQVVDVNFGQALVLCPLHDGAVEEALNHLRKNGNNVYAHNVSFCFFCKSSACCV